MRMTEKKKTTTTKKTDKQVSKSAADKSKKTASKKSATKKTTKSNDTKKQKVPSGLYQKPIRRQGGLIGSRELTSGYAAESTLNIPQQEKGAIRVLFFGGVGEIGKNMYGIEYEDDILLLDCGMKFAQNDTPGIDFIVPNIQYLEERKEKIKGLVISHAHLDHIGGISVIMNRIGNPPLFSRKLSIELIRNRQGEFENKEPITYHEVEKSTVLKLSENLTLTFFSVTHTIPDSMGIVVETPIGAIVFTGDLKLTHEDGVVGPEEIKEFAAIKKKNVLLTMADSTNAERPGFSLPEKRVVDTIGTIIKETKGRVILSAFSTQIERTIRVIEHAIENGRKVIVQGRSMITNLTIASELGLLKIPLTAIIPVEKMGDYPKEKLLVLATGAQGDNFTAMDRMSRGTHRHIKLDNKDTVVFSSSIIPGNEEPVQNLKDRLSKLGVDLITYQTSDVHSSDTPIVMSLNGFTKTLMRGFSRQFTATTSCFLHTPKYSVILACPKKTSSFLITAPLWTSALMANQLRRKSTPCPQKCLLWMVTPLVLRRPLSLTIESLSKKKEFLWLSSLLISG